MSSSEINDSQFHMWRALFAVAHADDIVSAEEVHFMAAALEDVPFSEGQRAILNEDIKYPQDIETMFKAVEDQYDQAMFFKLAHELVHIDGDYGAEEQEIMLKLKALHVKTANVDDLVGRIQLELDDGSGAAGDIDMNVSERAPSKNYKGMVASWWNSVK